MNIQSLTQSWFSPTGTSRRIVQAISQGLAVEPVNIVDATLSGARETPLRMDPDGVLVLAVPVYAGRVPKLLLPWLESMELSGCPVVCVVVYGNREFDDALLELRDLVQARGGVPVACAAFIGEHSFSSPERPTAAGRPDAQDLDQAQSFGRKVRETLDRLQTAADAPELQVPGEVPYRSMPARPPMDFIAVNEACTLCGVCAEACPVDAIDMENDASVVVEKCIRCCACIKACPEGARTMKQGTMMDISTWLHENCGERKEPVLIS